MSPRLTPSTVRQTGVWSSLRPRPCRHPYGNGKLRAIAAESAIGLRPSDRQDCKSDNNPAVAEKQAGPHEYSARFLSITPRKTLVPPRRLRYHHASLAGHPIVIA